MLCQFQIYPNKCETFPVTEYVGICKPTLHSQGFILQYWEGTLGPFRLGK